MSAIFSFPSGAPRRFIIPGVFCLAWLCAVGAGLAAMWSYETRPGIAAAAPVQWSAPAEEVAPSKPTLVVLAHPRCPCTNATMDELTELMTRAEGALQARVYFFHPKDTSVEWARTTLWKRAAAIPGVEVVADANGDAARRFGAVTSGQALLYSAEGRLLFSGGLTNSRGHSGESAGRLAVLSVLASRRPGVDSTPVFGCPIIRAGGSAKGILTP